MLLLTDAVDAFWSSAPLDFDGKPLKSLSQGEVNLDLIPRIDEDATKDEPKTETDEAATIAVDQGGARRARLRREGLDALRPRRRSCLVAGGAGPDRELERMLAMQNRGSVTKPILEINLRHPLVAKIAGADKAAGGEASDIAFLLLEQAQILDGELPEDPAAFAQPSQPAGAARFVIADHSRRGAFVPALLMPRNSTHEHCLRETHREKCRARRFRAPAGLSGRSSGHPEEHSGWDIREDAPDLRHRSCLDGRGDRAGTSPVSTPR